MRKTIEQILVKPVIFRNAMDLVFSSNPQKDTTRRAKVWRSAAYQEELLGEVAPFPRDGKIEYKILDADGAERADVHRLGDSFNVLRSLDGLSDLGS